MTQQSFAELFEESLQTLEMRPGSIVKGTVLAIDSDWVTVNAGLKSEGIIPTEQFKDDNGVLSVQVGDVVDVAIESFEDGFGETKLSREKAKRAESWIRLESAFKSQELITGMISGKVKGGFTVEIDNIRAFLPGSLVDVRPIKDTSHLEGKELEFKVIKLDPKRNNVVVSRRAVLETENSAEREQVLSSIEEGAEMKGVVKNLTDYGAFVDLGGIDGLLHITDMAWRRIKHPSEVVAVGDELQVKILKFDRDKSRVSLGLKQLGSDPWVNIRTRYPEGAKLKAKITNLADYGCFAEIETGVEGLVHVSEMDWTNKNIHPSKVVGIGDEVEVMILDIDEERRRISLGMKQCRANPWDEFSGRFEKGEKISGKIKSITDFGVFIGLDGGIDGLVHLSDLSWQEAGEEVVKRLKKGDDLETVILSIDPERERISLGVKQLNGDPFNDFLDANDKGSLVKGKVIELDAKGAILELAQDVPASLRASELSKERVEDARTVLNLGDEVEARIISVDRKSRSIVVSVKAIDAAPDFQEPKASESKVTEPAPVAKTIGDLIKQQMSGG
jgi:small subunit ribosomal protein S1